MEIVLLLAVGYFLIFPYTYMTAMLVYLGYQFTFVFGSYLLRAETLIVETSDILTTLDTAKQLGYLIGMGVSFLFYKLLEHYAISDNQDKIYNLHYILIAVEITIIALILKSFTKDKSL